MGTSIGSQVDQGGPWRVSYYTVMTQHPRAQQQMTSSFHQEKYANMKSMES